MNTETRTLFGLKDVAERWGISTFTVRRLIDKGNLQSINIGARVMIPLSEIERAERFGVGTARPRKHDGN